MTTRFRITIKRPAGKEGEAGWVPAMAVLNGGEPRQVYVDAPSGYIARDLACRHFSLSKDEVQPAIVLPEQSALGLMLVEDMGVVEVRPMPPPVPAKVQGGVTPASNSPWERITPFRSAFSSIVVRAADLSDTELRLRLYALLRESRPQKRKVTRKVTR